MNPTIELRVRTMIRALNEIIIPAIDPNNSLAQEQAGLLLGHLSVFLEHEGREQTICEIERAGLAELANALLKVCEGGEATNAASERLRNLGDDIDTLSHAIESLVIDAGIDGSDAFKRSCDELVLKHAREATLQSRIWFKSMGFDHDPEVLPGIDSLFK